MMEVMEDITVDEKRDMLLEMLADLYTIKAANKEIGRASCRERV